MNICMLAYTFYDRDNRVIRYAETLAKHGHHVDVIALKKEGQASTDKLNGVNIYRIQKRTVNEKGKLSYLLKLIYFFINSSIFLAIKHLKNPYDLLHIHSVPDFEVFAAWLPKLMGSKIILDIHDIVPEFYASKFNKNKNSIIYSMLIWLEKMSIRFSDHVVISNHLWQKTLISRSVKEDKCSVILNYPDPSIFFFRNQLKNHEQFIILYPGTLNKHQGLDVAIEAFSIIKEKIKNAQFHIYGYGPEKENLLSLIKDKNLEEVVFIKDFKPLHEIGEIMARADLAIVPKRKDTFGNKAFSTKILEFMALGVPVIAADTAIDRYYFDESNIMFFEAGNIDDLVKKILFIYNNNKLKESLINGGFKLVETMNWDVSKYLYLDILYKLTNHKESI